MWMINWALFVLHRNLLRKTTNYRIVANMNPPLDRISIVASLLIF